MNFKEYQERSRVTAVYPQSGSNYVYPTLGLAGETGEVVEKVKKTIRNDGAVMSPEKREEIGGELGDVLWYLSQLATELELDLETIATKNLEKLASRKERGVLHSSGDVR